MKRTILAATVGTLAVAMAAPAMAAPKKPITKSYTASAPLPDPSNTAGAFTVCAQRVPMSFDKRAFKAPAAGKFSVTLNGYTGDWDLLITDASGAEVTGSGSGGYGSPQNPNSAESTTIKIKKPGTYNIIACNWAGSATAKVAYTFTYAK